MIDLDTPFVWYRDKTIESKSYIVALYMMQHSLCNQKLRTHVTQGTSITRIQIVLERHSKLQSVWLRQNRDIRECLGYGAWNRVTC